MAPKKKGTKIALTDFLNDDKLGSWADEMDALPTAPAPRAAGEYDGPDDFMSRTRDREAFSGQGREEHPLPTQAPWTVFLGNLAFDVTESDVNNFFSGLSINSVKLIADFDGKPKGFGYVEFGSLESLKEALSRSGEQLASRTVRVSVAEPPKGAGSRLGGKDAFSASFMAAEESSQWRRSGPLPPLPGGGGPSSGAGPRSSSFANASAPGAADTDRDWSAVRGSKFVPSAEASPRMGQAPLRSGGFVSENAAKAEAANEWRSSKPLATGPPPPSGGGSYRDVPPHQRGPPPPSGPADTEEQWTRGAKFTPSVDRADNPRSSFGGRGGGGFQPAQPAAPVDDSPSDWRSKRVGPPSRQGSSGDRSPAAPGSPNLASRRPLTLLPRTSSSTSPSPSSGEAAPSASKANPFGAARPVDAREREREVEERLLAQQEAIRAKAAAASAANKGGKFVPARGGAPVSKKTPSGGEAASEKPAEAKVAAPAAGEEATPLATTAAASAADEDGFVGAEGKGKFVADKEAKRDAPKEKTAYEGLEVEGGEDEDDDDAALAAKADKLAV